jgi:hypothetical protein
MIHLDKHHVILYAVAIAFALGLTYVVESKLADHNEQKYEAMKALSDQKDSTNAQFQKQIVDQLAQMKAENDQQVILNTQDRATITSLQQQLRDQKTKDATLPPTDLAARIQTLAPGGTVTVAADGYKLDRPEAVAVVQALEEPATLNTQITLDEKIIQRDDTIITNEGKALDSEKAAHAADVATLVADKATLNQQIVTIKAEARKSKLKWFLAGLVTGFGLGRIHNLPL